MNLGNLGFLSLPKAVPNIKSRSDLIPLNPYKYWLLFTELINNKILY
jgi:hypothetical protein